MSLPAGTARSTALRKRKNSWCGGAAPALDLGIEQPHLGQEPRRVQRRQDTGVDLIGLDLGRGRSPSRAACPVRLRSRWSLSSPSRPSATGAG